MESLSRPLNRRRLTNVSSFSGKNAYDGVFSGHRRKHDGAPVVKVEEYGEIFSAGCSIPVLDLPTLEESCDGLDMEMWSRKPDYAMIFGGFCDQDIAICYEDLLARDNARACAPSSASQSSQNLGDLSNQALDPYKQFNMAYNKISQRSKDGLDGTTHVTQLPAVSGFTCFMGESASQPKKETKKQKSFKRKNIHPSVNSSKGDFHEKQTSKSAAESGSTHQVESLTSDTLVKTSEVDLKPYPSKVSSPPATSELNKKTENQKSYITNNTHPSVNSSKADFHEKQTSQSALESGSTYGQDESLSGDTIIKTFEVDLKPYPSKVSSPPAVSEPNKETSNQKSYVHPNANSNKGGFHEKQTSRSGVESGSRYSQDESFEVDLKSYPSKVSSPPASSEQNKETGNQESYITNNIHPSVKQTPQSAVESRSRHGQDESSSSDGNFKPLEGDLKPLPSKVFSPPTASQPNKESENEKSYVTNIHPSVNSSKGDSHVKETSQSAVESRSRYNQDEALSTDGIFNTFEVDLKPLPSKVPSPPAASQPNKETENQKSYLINNTHSSVNSSKGDFHEKQTLQSAAESSSGYGQDESLSGDELSKTFEVDLKPYPSKVSSLPASSQPNKETETRKSYVTNNIHSSVNSSSKGNFDEKQTSQSAVESRSRYVQDESLFGDDIFKNFEVDLKPHPSKVLSPTAVSQSNKETENQNSSITNNVHPSMNSSKDDLLEKQTSQSSVESRSRYGQDESISDDVNFKKFQADLRSSPRAASATYFDNHKDYQKRSTATYGESPSTCFDEEHDVNSAAAVSAAALRKAIEKAQENIRIAKESVGRKKGLGGFSSKSFKESLKVKVKASNVKAVEDHKHESAVVFPDFMDYESLFGSKKVINEPHGKVPELGKNSEIPIRSPVELGESKILSSSKRAVGKTESEAIETNTCEGSQKDVEKPNRFLVLDSCEKELGDTESNNLNVHQKLEDVKEIPGESDENVYEKRVCEESSGLFKINKQAYLEREHDEKVASAVSQVEDEREVKAEEEENEVYDVCEVEIIKNADIQTHDLSQKEDHKIEEKEHQKAEETWKKLENIQVPEIYENSSSYHDDTENSENVIGARQIVDDTAEACKVEQNDNNAESSPEIGEVCGSSSSGHDFQVEDTEAIEKAKIENVSSNEAEDKVECVAESDDSANCNLTDVDFVQNEYSIETNDLSPKEDNEIKEQENYKAEETWEKLERIQVPETYENSSNDYNDADQSESVIGASQVVDDTEDASKVDQNNEAESSKEIDDVSSEVDQNDNKAESSQEVDDVSSSSSSGHDFHVEDMEALEIEIIENIFSDETEDSEGECDAKSDDLANCGLANVDFVQNDVRPESFSDTIFGREIEIKEHREREETVEEEDGNLQQSHEETPEFGIKTETETQDSDDKSNESELSKTVEKMHNEEEREQERIKLAVERAIREARARAFAEVRQRVIADTQEKVTKASSDKTCVKSKLKAERAAVERATAEARQRALEKAISQKKISEPKIQVKEISETTSDINNTNTESALRSKAKLEKHNRIMERAAKALAEKEMRDLLALREQAERSRLAENLDADIKRWSGGKEGNLRALLSTLQYILGADSGWQPVSLTEIITTSAVKKAYRKATLCVHPDKLQQRGASIQQKYICEKVFDLLKAAWNRFNSEER